MKNIFYICLAIGFMFSSVTFVSCGGDDEKSNPENTTPQKTADRDEAGNIKITATNFPDPVFRGYLYDKYGADGVFSDAEIDNVTQLSLSNKGVKTLEGIEFFPLLEKLFCSGNQLTSLDVSKNTALTYLGCSGNQLTSLDVSKNTALTELYCYSNKLTSLDVSKNTKLTGLYCYENQLTSLDVSGCNALRELSCYNNQIKGAAMDALVESLPTVSSGDMRVIHAVNDGNVMTKTQIRAARAKGWIPMFDSWRTQGSWVPCGWEDGIDVVEINFPDKSFREYLLSTDYGVDGVLTDKELKNVIQINVPSQEIQSLQGIEYFTALTSLRCYNNQLTSLDVSKNTALEYLDCYYNQLTSLDVSKNTALTYLSCGLNKLTSLDVSKNTALTMLYCFSNKLTSLDVSKNTALTGLSCGANQLTSLDVSGCTALTSLECYGNQLTSLDVSKNTALTRLECDPSVTVTGWPK